MTTAHEDTRDQGARPPRGEVVADKPRDPLRRATPLRDHAPGPVSPDQIQHVHAALCTREVCRYPGVHALALRTRALVERTT